MIYCKMNGMGGVTRLTGRTLRLGDRIYVNPDRETLAKAGYFPLSDEPRPEIGAEEALFPVYTQEETVIRRGWRIVRTSGGETA